MVDDEFERTRMMRSRSVSVQVTSNTGAGKLPSKGDGEEDDAIVYSCRDRGDCYDILWKCLKYVYIKGILVHQHLPFSLK